MKERKRERNNYEDDAGLYNATATVLAIIVRIYAEVFKNEIQLWKRKKDKKEKKKRSLL